MRTPGLGSRTAATTAEMPDGTRAAVDLLVRHGYLITMDDQGTAIADGAVAIDSRRIVDVGADEDVAARWGAARTIFA